MSSFSSSRHRRSSAGCLLRHDAGLLRLLAGVDLDEELQAPPLLRHLLGDGLGDLRPVDGVDGIEQRHRLPGLVGLQRPDQVQLDVGVALAQGRPLGLGLLHAVLAEQAVAGVEHRRDVLGPERLGDGDQIDRRRLAPGRARSRGDARRDARKPLRLRVGSICHATAQSKRVCRQRTALRQKSANRLRANRSQSLSLPGPRSTMTGSSLRAASPTGCRVTAHATTARNESLLVHFDLPRYRFIGARADRPSGRHSKSACLRRVYAPLPETYSMPRGSPP